MVMTNEDDPAAEHSRPSIRICKIEKNRTGSYGFHLTRTKWDPYPWIAGVDDGSIAQASGLKVGDCILEVNGEDVIGLRVGEIANKALSAFEHITMLLWNAGSDANCDTESLCCTPMPTSLSRLSSCLSSVLSFLECPVCFEIISPPAYQCSMGHLICYRCREEIERCPVCRTNFTRERSLLADQIYTAVIEAFHLKNQTVEERTKKLWERIFGKKKREKNQSRVPTPKTSKAFEIKNKFLTRLIGKSSSVDNLSSEAASFGPSLRKKSISSCDLSSSSQAGKINKLIDSYSACSAESLPNDTISRFSSNNTSCEMLNNANRNFYRNRPNVSNARNNTFDKNVESLFQFSTDISMGNSGENDTLYQCPVSDTCSPMSPFSLYTHLNKHSGPIIQYFKPNFSINFPFSFDHEAVFIVNCYETSFFYNIIVDNDVKVYIWLIGSKEKADQFRAVASLQGAGDSLRTELSFITFVNTIIYEPSRNVHANQIRITGDTLQNYFPERFFTMHMSIVKTLPENNSAF